MPQARLGGGLTHWVAHGQGPDRTLLIHCALGAASAWRGVMTALPDRRHLAFDLPGHGRSGPSDPTQEPSDEALSVAEALMDAEDGPMDVIGHSFGGVVALRLALTRPQRVRSLVLVEPVLFAAAEAEARDTHLAQSAALTDAFASREWERATRLFLEVWGNGARWEDLRPDERAYILERIPLIPRSNPALYEDLPGTLPRLGEVQCPVLLVSGDRSPPVIPAILAGLVARLPRTEQCVIPGAGHMVPLSHPQLVAARIAAFLDGGAGERRA